MTISDFTFICNLHSVSPEIALENKDVKKVLAKDKRNFNNSSSMLNQILLSHILKEQF